MSNHNGRTANNRPHTNKDYRVGQVARPNPGAREMVIRVSACGICASDCKCWAVAKLFWGDPATGMPTYVKPPVIPGREFFGVVDEFGESVVIAGAGPIGLMMVHVAKLKTPKKLIVIDMVAERLELARGFGADVVINPCDQDALADSLESIKVLLKPGNVQLETVA